MDALSIDCNECRLVDTSACEDCVVSFLLEPPRTGALVVDAAEARAVRLLASAGLVPSVRFGVRAS